MPCLTEGIKWPSSYDGIHCKINISPSMTLVELSLALVTELRRYYKNVSHSGLYYCRYGLTCE